MAFQRVQFSKIFPREHAPGPPYIIRVIGADSPVVSPVTWRRNHEYQDSNDSASTPDLVREGRLTQALVVQKIDNYTQRIP